MRQHATHGIIGWDVDTQYDFMRPDGKLYVPGAELIEPKLKKLTDILRGNAVRIVKTRDWHTENTAEIAAQPDFASTFPEHCMAGTQGAENIPATAPRDAYIVRWDVPLDLRALKDHTGDIILTKDHFDAFHGAPQAPYADQVLRMLNPGIAIVYGVATNVCVDFAVKGLLQRGVGVVVPTDAIKGLHIPGREEATVIQAWADLGAQLTTIDQTMDTAQELYAQKQKRTY